MIERNEITVNTVKPSTALNAKGSIAERKAAETPEEAFQKLFHELVRSAGKVAAAQTGVDQLPSLRVEQFEQEAKPEVEVEVEGKPESEVKLDLETKSSLPEEKEQVETTAPQMHADEQAVAQASAQSVKPEAVKQEAKPAVEGTKTAAANPEAKTEEAVVAPQNAAVEKIETPKAAQANTAVADGKQEAAASTTAMTGEVVQAKQQITKTKERVPSPEAAAASAQNAPGDAGAVSDAQSKTAGKARVASSAESNSGKFDWNAQQDETASNERLAAALKTTAAPAPEKSQELKAPVIPVQKGASALSSQQELLLQKQAFTLTVDKSAKDSQQASAFNLTTDRKISGAKDVQSVARTTAPNQARAIEQIQKVMDEAIRTRNANTIVVKLNPAELGNVTVKVTQRAEQIFARVIPESKDVEASLKANLHEVVQALAAAGIKAENLHVSVGQEISETPMFGFHYQSGQGAANEQGGEERSHQPVYGQNDVGAEVITPPVLREELSGWVA